jgi:hypothetical protein
MTFQFIPAPNHIETTGEPPTYTSKWRTVGDHRESYVNAYTLGATPAVVSTIYGTLYRQDIRVTQTAFNQFDVVVPYGKRKNETGQWTWDFDTTGGTVHITHAKEELRRYPNNAPDQKGAIAVDRDEVKGTEIVIPVMRKNVTFKHPLGVVTDAFSDYLFSITGTVNSSPMLNRAPGEVLFLGARGSDGTDAEASISYAFAISPNASGLTFGDISGVVKKGHEVAWVRYKDDVASGKPTRIPWYVYVDRIYDEIDLATALGFGG